MFPPHKLDPIVKAPDLLGSAGKAWKADIAALRRAAGVAPENDSTLVHWIVEAAWAHPCWHSYSIALIHLRPTADGQAPEHWYLDGATHELWVYALDPAADRSEIVRTGKPSWLHPGNFAAQIVAPGERPQADLAALARIQDAVQRVCDGRLSPDTDYIRHWAHLFGDNMLKAGAGETRLVIDPGGPGEQQIVIPPKPGPQDLH